MKMIIIGLVVGLAAAGGAFFFLKGDAPPVAVELAAPAAAPGEDGETAAPVVEDMGSPEDESAIYDLEPFIVNLADTTKVRYLKLTVKLDLIRGSYSSDLDARMPQIRDSLLILLSSKEHSEIRTVEGKMELRDEILQRVNSVYRNNKVKMAYFTDFVTQ